MAEASADYPSRVPVSVLMERRLARSGQWTAYQWECVAVVVGETVKGFTLVWPAEDAKRRSLVLAALERLFNPVDGVLPDIVDGPAQSIDLLSGLQIRRPDKSRSGFFVSNGGEVVTTTEVVGACERITLGEDTDAEITAEDTASGLVLLTPRNRLAPLAVARLSPSPPRLQSEVAVAGYSFGGALGSPTLTYGSIADVKGLTGDAGEDVQLDQSLSFEIVLPPMIFRFVSNIVCDYSQHNHWFL